TKAKSRLDHILPRTKALTSLVESASKLFNWQADAQTSQALTLLCLSSSDAVSQGLVRPIEVESTVQPVPAQPTQDSSGQPSPDPTSSSATSTDVSTVPVQT